MLFRSISPDCMLPLLTPAFEKLFVVASLNTTPETMLPLTIAPEAIFINVISLAAVVVSLPEVTTTLVKGELPPSKEAYLATLVAKFDDVCETVISVAYVSLSVMLTFCKRLVSPPAINPLVDLSEIAPHFPLAVDNCADVFADVESVE